MVRVPFAPLACTTRMGTTRSARRARGVPPGNSVKDASPDSLALAKDALLAGTGLLTAMVVPASRAKFVRQGSIGLDAATLRVARAWHVRQANLNKNQEPGTGGAAAVQWSGVGEGRN